jgi:hypothetical protein
VRCERRLSKSDLRVLSCYKALARYYWAHCADAWVLTSSDLLGRGASSSFFTIFCVRLSLLAGRAAVLSSSSLTTERLAVGVLPRAVLALGAILEEGCEPGATCAECDEFIEDDEFLGRAVTCGVVRLSMTSRQLEGLQRVFAWASV